MKQRLKYLLSVLLCSVLFFLIDLSFKSLSAQESLNQSDSLIIAKKSSSSSSSSSKRKKPLTKAKDITGEAKVGQRSTRVSFEDTDIAGERRGGLGSVIEEGQVDKEVDLIKIRYSWHPEMRESTSSLETGKTE